MANAGVVYAREYNGQDLNFEPSGGLMSATLVMRDRETDSWWGMIAGRAIMGPLEGQQLTELPVSEKTTWGAWRERHPNSLVLSVKGAEHEDRDPYENYLTTDRTFGDGVIADDRLGAKESIYAFQLGGSAYAVTHRTAEGGCLLHPGDGGDRVFLFREEGAAVYASTRAYLVPEDALRVAETGFVLADNTQVLDGAAVARALDEIGGVHRLGGYDTFWYSWAPIHPGTVILD